MAQRFRKKPVIVEAMRFDGSNHAALAEFTGGKFEAVHPDDRTDDPEITASVFDVLHSTWVGVKDGHYIIRGAVGEFYPCDPGVFEDTYDLV